MTHMIHIDTLDSPSIDHGFFTREGGISEGHYSSLNCGFSAADDPMHVGENRARALRALGLTPDCLAIPKQVHGADVVQVEIPWRPTEAPRADALVTRVPGLALGILTADCVPVLLADAKSRVVGAAHAGWRGAFAGVIEATVAAMQDLDAMPHRMAAAIGPAIAQRSYEVGPEFLRRFLAQDPANSVFFVPSPRAGRFLFDLKCYVARRLEILGIGTIAVSDIDTVADAARFFSYRRACLRGEPGHGLGLSAIALAR